ncbi:hypothetical protein Golomagni_02798 [Golovinomyces magnicellulatus]|nr:hypothetical protein Golomagni_02798 [Golovinomyces magnicellulatus]
MSSGQRNLPVFLAACSGLLGSGGKFSSCFYEFVTSRHHHSTISRIIDIEMLGRAAKEYIPPSFKPDSHKALLFPSDRVPKGNIEKLRKEGKSTKPSADLKSYLNNLQTIQNKSPITDQTYKKKSIVKSPGSSIRSISTSRGLLSVLSSQNSYQDTYESINMEKKGPINSNSDYHFVDFNEDDFDEDDDLDFDFENILPNPMAERVISLQNLGPSTSRDTTATTKSNQLTASQDKPSSAITWPSSSPSHQLPSLPQGQGMKRETEEISFEDSSQPVRPMKRRTLPWLQKQAEDDLISSGREKAEQALETTTHEFPNESNGHRNDYMPWNNSGSSIKESKKKLKSKQKLSKKKGDLSKDMAKYEQLQAKLSVTPLSLSDEQKRVLDLVINHSKSVFFTGSAGTGKSVLMRAIIAELRKIYAREPDRVAVTASTGLAACNIGGVTLHSFGGIGLGKDDIPALVRKIKRNPKAKLRWLRTKVLILDEVSMVDGELFDKLEGIARALRNNGRPFGGIQLVITGDFFQLPPVPEFGNKSNEIKFAFDAGTWSTSIHHTIGLTQVFRQKDPEFANMLNDMRLGKITEKTELTFKSLNRSVASDGLEATELFPTRREVENANASRMQNLNGESHKYLARDGGLVKDVKIRDKLLSNMMAPKVLELKKGAQVMLIKNMDDGLVNGTIGKVRSFMSERDFKLRGETAAGLEKLEGNSEDEMSDEELNPPSLKTISRSQGQDGLKDSDPAKLYPFVSFKLSDGTRRMMLILPEEWKVELPSGEVQALRVQVPLILAWALSIHKAQGQTLPRVKIDLKKVFEKGQAYVALSRATTQAGLQVLNFDKSKVLAHPRVAQFYNSLYTVNNAKM